MKSWSLFRGDSQSVPSPKCPKDELRVSPYFLLQNSQSLRRGRRWWYAAKVNINCKICCVTFVEVPNQRKHALVRIYILNHIVITTTTKKLSSSITRRTAFLLPVVCRLWNVLYIFYCMFYYSPEWNVLGTLYMFRKLLCKLCSPSPSPSCSMEDRSTFADFQAVDYLKNNKH